jgi:hypothetical protein
MLIKVNIGIVAQSILKGLQPTFMIMSISIYKPKNRDEMVRYWRKPILFCLFLFLFPSVLLPLYFSLSLCLSLLALPKIEGKGHIFTLALN